MDQNAEVKVCLPVQICFAADANLENVRTQLETLKKENPEFHFLSCFLPRHIVEQKGFHTQIVDTIDEVLGEDHTYVAQDCMNFEEYQTRLDDMRMELASQVHRMFVLDSGTASGVGREIELFTGGKVVLIK